MIRRVTLARTAKKQLRRVPRHVAVKLQAWIEMVENQGSGSMAFLEDVTGGPLTLGNLLLSIRLGEEMSQAAFARTLKISRSHLCDLEKGRKTISPQRASRFARILGYSEPQFVRLALQAMVEDAGLNLTVQVVPA